jgi:hypothetical protein
LRFLYSLPVVVFQCKLGISLLTFSHHSTTRVSRLTLVLSRATGAMRVGGPNPIDNLTRAATELNTVAGAKINMDT